MIKLWKNLAELKQHFSKAYAFCSYFVKSFYAITTGESSLKSKQLVEEHLKKRSAIDNFAYSWSKRSFLRKLSTLFSFIGITGIVRLIFWSSPIFVAILSAFVAFNIHLVLVAHEQNRHESASFLVKNTVALDEKLQDIEKQAQEQKQAVDTLLKNLALQETKSNERQLAMGQTIQHLEEKNSHLSLEIKQLQEKTEQLTLQETQLKAATLEATQSLQQLKATISESTQTITNVTESATQFAECVTEIRQEKEVLSAQVKKFGLFVEKSEPTEEATPTTATTDNNRQISSLNKHRQLNDFYEELIKKHPKKRQEADLKSIRKFA